MERSLDTDGSMLDTDEALERSREVLGSPLYEKSAWEKFCFYSFNDSHVLFTYFFGLRIETTVIQ